MILYVYRYPTGHVGLVDTEDDNHHVVPGAWREGLNMHDMDNVAAGNQVTRAGKGQRMYLTHYYNSPAGAVHWQERMV